MNKQIKQIQQQFIDRIRQKDYLVINVDEYVITFDIQGYEFSFWVKNELRYFSQYHEKYNFLDLDLDEEALSNLWDDIQPTLKELKVKQIRDLEKQLNELKNGNA